MKLRQLKIDFNPEGDRLLMQLSTSEGAEMRLWLTRRFVKLLWPLLVQLAEDASPRIRTQANPDARKALLSLETGGRPAGGPSTARAIGPPPVQR